MGLQNIIWAWRGEKREKQSKRPKSRFFSAPQKAFYYWLSVVYVDNWALNICANKELTAQQLAFLALYQMFNAYRLQQVRVVLFKKQMGQPGHFFIYFWSFQTEIRGLNTVIGKFYLLSTVLNLCRKNESKEKRGREWSI